jgi:hypothetical protein
VDDRAIGIEHDDRADRVIERGAQDWIGRSSGHTRTSYADQRAGREYRSDYEAG